MKNKICYKRAASLLNFDTVSMLTQIHELKGCLTVYTRENPYLLNHIACNAMLDSIVSSSKLSGLSITDQRLRMIALNKVRLSNPDETEIAGYRDTLAAVKQNYSFMPLTISIVLQIHRDLYKHCGNHICGLCDNQEALENVCAAFDKELYAVETNPLLLILLFEFDFLCLHPFDDGNRRMSRLLLQLLLNRSGYYIGKYISLEKIIENTKSEYDNALQISITENNCEPFVRYMLNIILSAYKELSYKLERLTANKLSKSNRISETIKNAQGKITKSEIMDKHPDISQITVQRTLSELLRRGEIIKICGGRYTKYIWYGENDK